MPLYEYECQACGQRFELIRKFSDAPVETCSACGGPVRKLISSSAIQFKGTGWYITDYARKDTAGKAKTESESIASKSTASESTASKGAASESTPGSTPAGSGTSAPSSSKP